MLTADQDKVLNVPARAEMNLKIKTMPTLNKNTISKYGFSVADNELSIINSKDVLQGKSLSSKPKN